MGNVNDAVQQKMSALNSEIAALSDEINKVQQEYESLLRFRDSVSSAQNNFNEANDHRRVVLRDLDSVKTNNTVVQKYQSGMGDQLTGVGMKVVDAAFVGLQVMITARLAEYWNRLAGLNAAKSVKEVEYQSIDMMI